MKEKGITTAVIAAVIVIIVAVAGIGAYFMLKGPEEGAPPGGGAWVKENGVRVSGGMYGVTPMCTIVLPDNTYRMYYTSTEDGTVLSTFSAISADGLTWTKEGVRIENGFNSAVMQLDNGSYRMIFNEGGTPGGTEFLFWFVSATSTDRLTWVREPGIRLEDKGSVPDIIKLPDGRYRIYYCSPPAIQCAISSDNGLTWEKEPASGIIGADFDVIILPDGTYRVFYSDPISGGIYSAVSSDGLTWTKEEGARLTGQFLADPDVVELPDGTYRMYYCGPPNGGPPSILSAKSP